MAPVRGVGPVSCMGITGQLRPASPTPAAARLPGCLVCSAPNFTKLFPQFPQVPQDPGHMARHLPVAILTSGVQRGVPG